jgi:glycosyltransferase involved in cell wall biosynthesis
MLQSRPATVLASGRLIPLKNFDGLVRAFARVSPPSARLIILGDGPERPRLEAEIARLGLTGRVDLPGYIRDPWDYYAQASCFVVSSRSESFGMTVVEALANGLPVVSTDCGGPAEILVRSEDGTIVPLDDEMALAGAITAALADPGSPSLRMQTAERFAVPRAIDAYESLIAEIAGRARSPVPICEPA